MASWSGWRAAGRRAHLPLPDLEAVTNGMKVRVAPHIMKRAIAWFAENSVAANLLMALIVVGGILAIPVVKLEIFPEMRVDSVSIGVPLPRSLARRGRAGHLRPGRRAHPGQSTGSRKSPAPQLRGWGRLMVHVADWADVDTALDDIKAEIDSIDTFPAGSRGAHRQTGTIAGQGRQPDGLGRTPTKGPYEHSAKRVRDEIVALDECHHGQPHQRSTLRDLHRSLGK